MNEASIKDIMSAIQEHEDYTNEVNTDYSESMCGADRYATPYRW